MKFVGFNLNKINIEKFSDKFENLKINTQINVAEIKKDEINLIKMEEEVLSISFSYVINYDPNIAKIELAGKVLIMIDSKTRKEILNQWEKKQIPEEFKFILFNFILRKSNLKAMQLEEEMNIPLHIPMPSFRKKTEEQPDNSKNI